MKKAVFILLLTLLLILPGCSGCDKSAKKSEPPQPAAKPPTPEPTPVPVQEEKSEPKDTEEKEDSQKPTSPVSEMTEEESKQKVMQVIPDVVESFNSSDFKERLQDAAKSRDFKQLTQVMQSVINDACSKNGLSFEDCVKLMNEYKDDPEVKEIMEKWRNSFNFNP